MRPKNSKRKTHRSHRAQHHRAGKTPSPDARPDRAVSDSFQEVEPPGFQDHPLSSLEAAMVDPDVDDSEGGE